MGKDAEEVIIGVGKREPGTFSNLLSKKEIINLKRLVYRRTFDLKAAYLL